MSVHTKTFVTLAVGGALSLLAAPHARADVYDPDRPTLMSDYGMEVAVGGGVADFVDSNMRDFTGTAGMWDARLTFGTRSPIAIEAAYVGTAQSIDAIGLDTNSVLLGTTLEGNVRFNIIPDEDVQPYLVGGLGWRRYSLVNDNVNVSDINETDDTLEIPLGGGLAYRYRGFVADARLQYVVVTNEDLISTGNGDHLDMDSWNLGAKVGMEF